MSLDLFMIPRGPFGFLPFLECYHGIIALDAKLSGSLILNGETIDFSGGRAYIEKDWGTNFPSRWCVQKAAAPIFAESHALDRIWIQSSSFGDNDSVLTVSLATVPLGPLTIDGFGRNATHLRTWKALTLFPLGISSASRQMDIYTCLPHTLARISAKLR
jgi:hypothetical protein